MGSKGKSTATRYGTIAVTIHWLSALMIVALLGLGFRAANTVDPDAKAQLLSIHAPLGFSIFVLTLARIVWWCFADRKPDPAAGMPRWQHRSSRAVHLLFYVVILGMGSSGIGMLVLSDAGPIIFGSAAGPLPDFRNYMPRVPHGIGARFMLILLAMHIGAALYHHFIRRDGMLRRMWYGTD